MAKPKPKDMKGNIWKSYTPDVPRGKEVSRTTTTKTTTTKRTPPKITGLGGIMKKAGSWIKRQGFVPTIR